MKPSDHGPSQVVVLRISPNMRSIMGFLPDVKEGAKGLPGLKVTDFGTIPIAGQVFL